MTALERYRVRVRIRRDWPVKPEAEGLDGRELVVEAGWMFDEDETRGGIYRDEWAMILPASEQLLWIASGDLEFLERLPPRGSRSIPDHSGDADSGNPA